MNTKPAMYRQGDVLLVPVAELPKRAKRPERQGGRIVLALGEATGHAHAIAEPHAQLYDVEELRPGQPAPGADWRGGTFLEAKSTVALRHEEHGAILVMPGVYEVRRQREYRGHREERIGD